jgi:esterase/lipase superfamily enzyme
MSGFRLFLSALFIAALAGCTSAPPPHPAGPPVSIWFATDRDETTAANGYFGPGRHDNAAGTGTVTYGRADVNDPALKKPMTVTTLSKDEFFKQVNAAREKAESHRALIFIHGFRNTFERGIGRTAQIARDLHYPGPILAFAWPSRGTTMGYPRDAANARWATDDIEEFLLDVSEKSGAWRADILAHSMGNQPLVDALQEIAQEHRHARFGQVIMAAPDVDADIFLQEAPDIIPIASRLTLYTSSKDEALRASKDFNGFRRAGDASAGIVVLPGVDTIDVTTAGSDPLGHSYYRDARTVLLDIDEMLQEGLPTAQRHHVQPVTVNGVSYWKFVQ